MTRYIVVCLAACVAFAASAQEVVLVRTPPRYKQGEWAQGHFYGPDGNPLRLLQRAEGAGRVRLHVELHSVGGIMERSVVDLRTGETVIGSADGVEAVFQSSCKPTEHYPIVLGKTLECRDVMRKGGRTYHAVVRTTYDEATYDRSGKLTGFCARLEETTDVRRIQRMCYSPDGKWLREMRFIAIVPLDII
jgi:hypothetical protein